jgi:hypothetical protein
MSIKDEITAMYEKRIEKKEIQKMPTKTTIDKHARNLEKLHEHITGTKPTMIGQMSWLQDLEPEEVLLQMKSLKGRNSETIGLSAQQAYMFSILVAIRTNDFENFHKNDLYGLVFDIVNNKNGFKKEIKEHKENKENVFVPNYQLVTDIVSKYIREGPDLDFKIILKIYTTYPFRLEVADLKFLKTMHQYKTSMKEENYIVKKSRPSTNFFFSFNDYKTKETYGERKIFIKDKELTKLLIEKTKNMGGWENLFGENGMLRNTMSKKINLFFENQGVPGVNPTNLTKMVIKKHYDALDTGLREKQEELASQRGHSISTQMMVYLTE